MAGVWYDRAMRNPTFWKKFKIHTPIEYMSEVSVNKKIERQFRSDWRKFYRKSKVPNSPSRTARLDAFLRQLEKLEDDTRYCERIEIRYLGRKVGYGVFAKEDIPPYSALHHYAGVMKREGSLPNSNDSVFSFTEFTRYVIDGKGQGNWTRFMNHGDVQDEKTNVVVWEHYTEDGPRIIFTSGAHGVKKGDQLLYSYGDQYWEGTEFSSF